MNETSLTRFLSLSKAFMFLVTLTLGISVQLQAQPSCACKGSLQVSLDDSCEAVLTASQVLADGSTCGGTDAATVTIMKSINSDIIATGLGSATLTQGLLYHGKSLYVKVTSAPTTPGGPTNSCWSTINIEDKLKPTFEDCPKALEVTCPVMEYYKPVAIDNCGPAEVFMVHEDILKNDCNMPDVFLGPDTLKRVIRTFKARDKAGNVSDEICEVTFWVVSLDRGDIEIPKDIALSCDGDYARIPAGQPFAGHPSPININGKQGTGVPSIAIPSYNGWKGTKYNAGTFSIGVDELELTGGTAATQPNAKTLGAKLCMTMPSNGFLTFDYEASMVNATGGTAGGGANFNNDNPAYSVNGVVVNLASGAYASPVSGEEEVCVAEGDVFCFEVYTMNRNNYTILNLTNVKVPQPLYPNPDAFCNLFVSYSDVRFPEIKCVTKIMRTWQIIEWSCDSAVETYTQLIEIADKVGPVMTCPSKLVFSTNGHTCGAVVSLPSVPMTDNCSTNLHATVEYTDGFLNANGGVVTLPVGCQTVTYTAYDNCHNSSTCTVQIVVEDNTAPVAVCDQYTVVSLTQDATAWVNATSFDNGSYDECDLAKMLVRRMDPTPCLPCKTPQFPDFTFLGEYGTTPHYYYVSKHKSSYAIAAKTAAAMGGHLVVLNTANEDQWVYDKVSAWQLNEDYIIGLRDEKRKGEFAWINGETSTYRHWTSGSPRDLDYPNDYPYVKVLNADGTWYDYSAYECEEEEYLYVVEINDPCGFSEYVPFCCNDVNTTRVVVFRVIDKAGNWNDCMVNASVQDKLPPTIACPANVTITCNDNFDLTKLRSWFGWPTAFDNCEIPRIATDSSHTLNACRIGTITRNFTATDLGGRTAKCSQWITVTGDSHRFDMTEDRWPADVTTTGCEDPNDPAFDPDVTGRPDLTADNICSLVGADYEDQIFTFNNGTGEACFKILRHWTVIDWCQEYTSGGGTHYREWTHTQIIKVADPVKPVMTSDCRPKAVCTYDATCAAGYIELTASATDECTNTLRYNYRVDLYSDGSFDTGLSKSGLGNTANASGSYPVGTHIIEWSFEDRCGNVTKCHQEFSIVNCKTPTPYCISGLATSLMPVDTDNDGTSDSGMIEIWAKDFDNGSSHPCGYKVLLSFEPVTIDAQGKPVVIASKTFTCDDLGKEPVDIYAAVVTPMGNVVQDFCSTFIDIQDNNDACPDSGRKVKISGTIQTPENIPANEVFIELLGSELATSTNADGTYNFAEVETHKDYVVKPANNTNPLNGVSTLDLVFMQRHILDIEKITSPYKIIASDINKDGNVSVQDISELRKLILGVHDSFQNNQSWLFVDNNYVFQDPANANKEAYQTVYNISNLDNDMTLDFKAVKVGDVNGNVDPGVGSANVEARANSQLNLAIDNANFKSGETFQVPVYAQDAMNINGFQFTLNFNSDAYTLSTVEGMLPGMNNNNFGFSHLSDGILTVSYSKESAITLVENAPLMVLTFTAKTDGAVNHSIWLDSSVTPTEAYNGDFNVMDITMRVNNTNNDVVLYQNVPNPFKSITTVGFELPNSMEATLTFSDVAGRTLKVIKRDFNKGYNAVEINKSELESKGVIIYTLEAGDFTATRKMIVIE